MTTVNPSDTILIGGKYESIRDLYSSIKPDVYVEIGCYRLNTSINLMKIHMPKKAYLFDLFEKAPAFEVPPEVSPLSIEEASTLVKDNLLSHESVILVKGNTNSTIPFIIDEIKENSGHVFVFLDGGHSYATTMNDLLSVSKLNNKITLVVDDADWHQISTAIIEFMQIVFKRNPEIKYLKNNLCYIELEAIVNNTLEDIIKDSKTILDIGANIGQSYLEYRSLNKNAEILSIEANPNCENSLRSVGANYIITGLGGTEETKEFYINKSEPTCQGASFFKEKTIFYVEENTAKKSLAVKRLDDVVQGKSFDFIKIDTQGSELPIINGGIETVKLAKWLLIETPVVEYNEGSATAEEIENRLNEIGFVRHSVQKENFFGSTLVQRDILFKNTNNASD